jgi:hypothetical protein
MHLSSQDLQMSFNDEQLSYIREMSATPLDEKCYCAWFRLGECPHCPPGLSAADRVKVECPSCHKYPPARNLAAPITHRIGCASSIKGGDNAQP